MAPGKLTIQRSIWAAQTGLDGLFFKGWPAFNSNTQRQADRSMNSKASQNYLVKLCPLKENNDIVEKDREVGMELEGARGGM